MRFHLEGGAHPPADMKNLVMAGETLGLSAEKHDTFLTTFLGPLALIALIQIEDLRPKGRGLLAIASS